MNYRKRAWKLSLTLANATKMPQNLSGKRVGPGFDRKHLGLEVGKALYMYLNLTQSDGKCFEPNAERRKSYPFPLGSSSHTPASSMCNKGLKITRPHYCQRQRNIQSALSHRELEFCELGVFVHKGTEHCQLIAEATQQFPFIYEFNNLLFPNQFACGG